MPTYDTSCTQTLTVVEIDTGGRLFEMSTSQIIVISENDAPVKPVLADTLEPVEESVGVKPKISDTLNPIEILTHNYKPAQCLDFLSFIELLGKNQFSVAVLDEASMVEDCSHVALPNCYNYTDALSFIQALTVAGSFQKTLSQTLTVSEKRQLTNTNYNGVRSDSYYQG